jgi:soluble lytic murein transglycosylase
MHTTHSRPAALLLALGCTLAAPSLSCAQDRGTSAALSANTTEKAAEKAAPDAAAEPVPTHATDPDWVTAAAPGEPLRLEVATALDAGDWSTAFSLLEADPPQVATSPHGVFAHGWAAHRSGAHARAVEIMTALAAASPLLASDAHAVASEAAFALGDDTRAVSAAAGIERAHPAHTRALFVMASALERAGTPDDLARAERAYRAFLEASPGSKAAPTAAIALGALLEKRGAWSDAARVYNDVISHTPLAPEVPEVLELLARAKPKADAATRRAISAATHPQYMTKLRQLFGRHRSEQVLSDGARYLKSFEAGSADYCEALYLMAKSHSKLRKHADAAPVYTRLTKRCPGSKWEVKAYYNLGRSLWNADDDDGAIAAFEALAKRAPKSSYADDALLYVSRILRSQGKYEKARAKLRDQVRRYPEGDMAKDAHWLLVRDMFARDDLAGVLSYVDGLPDHAETDLYSRGRLAYFAGRAAELSGDTADADARYARVAAAHPLSYYALLALNRRAALAGATADDVCLHESGELCTFSYAPHPPIAVSPELAQNPRLRRGATFLRARLDSLARREFGALRSSLSDDDASLWALAMLLDSSGAYPLSHDIPRRRIDGWETQYPDASDQQWRVAFPTPFSTTVDTWAAKRELPRALVWAIMREESGFNPRVESWANARGLLQLMEGTARSVARDDGFGKVTPSDLFDPTTSVRLGSAYLAELAGQVDAHPALVIAGYNGGFGNVSGWLTARGDLPLDLWVEDIPYGQTRKYTKRVLSSFWTYQWLYEDRRTPVLPFDLSKVLEKK